MNIQWPPERTPVGVGLRHVHYHDALTAPADLDFIEVHSENFFARGGATLTVLEDIARKYPVSLHGTSLGLGSITGISKQHLDQLDSLVHRINPVMVSDHAAFTWGQVNGNLHHAGDLLPIAFNEQSLQTMTESIQQIQDQLRRTLFVENLSAYIEPAGSTLTETEFLNELVSRTGCKLLVDLNNLAVNAINSSITELSGNEIVTRIQHWIHQIPADSVGEIHLAGCTPVVAGEVMVDDHSQRVSEQVWQAYALALTRFGQKPTLIEWDTHLPEWRILLDEIQKARTIADQIFHKGDQ